MTVISPGMVETYSRLLVYSELEVLGIKGFMSQLLPKETCLSTWNMPLCLSLSDSVFIHVYSELEVLAIKLLISQLLLFTCVSVS